MLVSRLKTRNNPSGFTIIEVLIVMAVAGVIMAIVLLAVPSAQRNQRDNSRRAIAQRLVSSLETYLANNQGTYPFSGPTGTGSVPPVSWTDPGDICSTPNVFSQTCYDWYNNYVSGGKININDPSSGQPLTIRYSSMNSNPAPSWTPGDAYIGVGDICNGTSLASGTSSTKQFAMVMELENSGVWYCTDNR